MRETPFQYPKQMFFQHQANQYNEKWLHLERRESQMLYISGVKESELCPLISYEFD